ncbi:DUF1294 domain-containing protein [Tepidibacillus marianensis]|uniref:DUF1294 domain-containing protein n=1 Tax=Tepidibacillus marianensis TaxID=3131995 RepID=UPI0030D4D765
MELFIFIIFLFNLFTFFFFGNDKRKAKKGKWRTKEKTFFILSFVGGAAGIWIGMKWFHHKTLHPTYKYGIPVLVVWNLVIFYLLFR